MALASGLVALIKSDDEGNLQMALEMVITILISQNDDAVIDELYNANLTNPGEFCNKKHLYLLNKIQNLLVQYKFGKLKEKISDKLDECREMIKNYPS